jgi:hypothetical protein
MTLEEAQANACDARKHWHTLAQALAYDRAPPSAIMKATGEYLTATIDLIVQTGGEINEATIGQLQEIEDYLTSKTIKP